MEFFQFNLIVQNLELMLSDSLTWSFLTLIFLAIFHLKWILSNCQPNKWNWLKISDSPHFYNAQWLTTYFLAQILFTSHLLRILKSIEVYAVHNAIFRALDILTKILPTNRVQCIQTRTCLPPPNIPATQFFFSYIFIFKQQKTSMLCLQHV